MRFEVSSSELLRQLTIASGAINNNPVLPIMEDFLFSIKDDVLTITSTNLETTIITRLNVTADSSGAIAIPAKILLETIKALPEQPITFTVDENNGIKILSTFGVYKISGELADDFPESPIEDNVETFVIPSKRVLKGITNTVFATSSDELRLAMTGVLFHIDFTKIHFVGTDAHKLVKYTVGNLNTDITKSIIVPKKGLNLVKNAISEETDVTISFNKANIFFSFGGTKIVCRLIDAKYPEYNAVIPVENPYEAIINRKDFLNSMKRIAIYANKTTNQVILSLTERSMTISAQDLDFSNEATEQMNCFFTGEAMTIGFNAKFLGEMLNILENEEIKLQLSTPGRAGLLVPIEDEPGETLLMLIMPIMMGN
ncbi:MAG TPA: DNA polymerase III subunit beta [Saprospiraceae bacterium]|jgi:DNA polymerase-3 subunit beta|nr:DNA polymerase III subunit beta [Saprospiraceae bacterium]HRO08348.1 DNA polymerase III subunit beta [Saprospiraceae bacterium]HRO72139.1 DNA polymerase III subunit beta [Saprospiraceae bacterium]HRP41703.1 DNA polymerase III subunit beta [Saprospiraceae bacterium]